MSYEQQSYVPRTGTAERLTGQNLRDSWEGTRSRLYTPPGTLERMDSLERQLAENSAAAAKPHVLPPAALITATKEGRGLSRDEMRAFQQWLEVNPDDTPAPVPDALVFEATKHVSWRKPYARLLRICPQYLVTMDPYDHRVTNRWPHDEILKLQQSAWV